MYSKDGPFRDPVVRCESCQRLLRMEKVKNEGSCICGSRRVAAIKTFTEAEFEKMKKWGIDPEFLAAFEGVDDDD